jgi:phage FluMu protein Com
MEEEQMMKEFRCKFCHRLLAKVAEAKKVEIKCPKCKTMNLYNDEVVMVVQVDEDYLKRRIQKGKVSYNFIAN